jgi:hypothetical protein
MKRLQTRLQSPNQLRANIDLPHANRVNPDSAPAGKRSRKLLGISPEALTEAATPIPPAQHLQKVVGRTEAEEEEK